MREVGREVRESIMGSRDFVNKGQGARNRVLCPGTLRSGLLSPVGKRVGVRSGQEAIGRSPATKDLCHVLDAFLSPPRALSTLLPVQGDWPGWTPAEQSLSLSGKMAGCRMSLPKFLPLWTEICSPQIHMLKSYIPKWLQLETKPS